jgi:hypothetical protein
MSVQNALKLWQSDITLPVTSITTVANPVALAKTSAMEKKHCKSSSLIFSGTPSSGNVDIKAGNMQNLV